MFVFDSTERMWLSSWPAYGWHYVRDMLSHGIALVCGCDCFIYKSCQQFKSRIGVLCPRRAAKVPWYPWTKGDRIHDFRFDGIVSVYDLSIKGKRESLFLNTSHQFILCMANGKMVWHTIVWTGASCVPSANVEAVCFCCCHIFLLFCFQSCFWEHTGSQLPYTNVIHCLHGIIRIRL